MSTCSEQPMVIPLKQDAFLIFFLQRVLRSIEVRWSEIIRRVLDESIGPQWSEKAASFLGPKSRHHFHALSKADSRRFDLYILSELLVGFLDIFAQRKVANSSNKIHEDDIENAFIECKDAFRQALASLSCFRLQVAHAMRTVSAREVIAAFMAMHSLSMDIDMSSLEILPAECSCSFTQSSASVSLSETTGLSLTTCARLTCVISEAIRAVRLVYSGSQVSKVSLPPNFRIDGGNTSGPVFGVFAYQLLSRTEEIIRPQVRHYLLSKETTPVRYKGLERCGDDDQLDAQAIGDILVQSLKGRSPFAELLKDLLNRQQNISGHSSFKKYKDKLFSHLDRLLGPKNGLRNAITHSKWEQLNPKSILSGLESAQVVVRAITGNDESFSDLRLYFSAFIKSVKGGKRNDICHGPTGASCSHVALCYCSKTEQQSEIKDRMWINLPQPVNGLFGREETLREAFEYLQTKANSKIIISGESGVGKTAFAVELAKRLREIVPYQFWIPATTASSLHSALSQLSTILEEDHTPTTDSSPVQISNPDNGQHSASFPRQLLVFDDVQDMSLVGHFVLKSPHQIIITTMRNYMEQLMEMKGLNTKHIRLAALTTTHCLQIILEKLKRTSTSSLPENLLVNPCLYNWVEKCLGNIPLAAELAGSVLTFCTVEDSQKLLQFSHEQSLKDFCSDRPSGPGRAILNRGVHDTICLLLNKLKAEELSTLFTMCFLGGRVPCNHVHSLIANCSQHHDKAGKKCWQLWQEMGGERSSIHFIYLEQAGLMKLLPNGYDVYIHQLVKRAVLDWAYRKTAQIARTVLFGLTEAFLRFCQNPREVMEYRYILPSLLPMLESLYNIGSSLEDNYRLQLALWLARASHSLVGNIDLSSYWYRQAKHCHQTQQDAHPGSTVCVTINVEYGAVLWRQGHAGEAVKVLWQAMKDTLENCGEADALLKSCVSCDTQIEIETLWKELSSATLRSGENFRSVEAFLEATLASQGLKLETVLRVAGRLKVVTLDDALLTGPVNIVPNVNHRSSRWIQEHLFWLGVEKFSRNSINEGIYMIAASVDTIVDHSGVFQSGQLAKAGVLCYLASVCDLDVYLVCRSIFGQVLQEQVLFSVRKEKFPHKSEVVAAGKCAEKAEKAFAEDNCQKMILLEESYSKGVLDGITQLGEAVGTTVPLMVIAVRSFYSLMEQISPLLVRGIAHYLQWNIPPEHVEACIISQGLALMSGKFSIGFHEWKLLRRPLYSAFFQKSPADALLWISLTSRPKSERRLSLFDQLVKDEVVKEILYNGDHTSEEAMEQIFADKRKLIQLKQIEERYLGLGKMLKRSEPVPGLGHPLIMDSEELADCMLNMGFSLPKEQLCELAERLDNDFEAVLNCLIHE